MAFQKGFQRLHLSFKANGKGAKGISKPSREFKEEIKRLSGSLESQLISDIKS